MSKKVITKHGVELKVDSICFDCVHSVPNAKLGYGCERSIDNEPVPGWRAEETVLNEGYQECKSYLVTGCPKFKCDLISLGDVKMNPKAAFEELVQAVVERAVDDWVDAYDEMNRHLADRQISMAIEAGRVVLDVEDWFERGCGGFVTSFTARKILKRLRTAPIKKPSEAEEETPEAVPQKESVTDTEETVQEEQQEEVVSFDSVEPSAEEPQEEPESIIGIDIKEQLSKDINEALKHYVTKKESKTDVMNAYRKAEYAMYKTFNKDPKLCKICRRHQRGDETPCKPCRFDWKGKPIE